MGPVAETITVTVGRGDGFRLCMQRGGGVVNKVVGCWGARLDPFLPVNRLVHFHGHPNAMAPSAAAHTPPPPPSAATGSAPEGHNAPPPLWSTSTRGVATGTLCTAKKPLIYGNGDTLHCQKAPHIWRWGHFTLPKSPSYMAMGTLCTAKKPLIYGDGDTLHCQKAPHVWRWGYFALPKSPSYMAIGTLCTAKKPLIYGDGDNLHCQKAPHVWRWGYFALPKSPSYMAIGTLCTAKKPLGCQPVQQAVGEGPEVSQAAPIQPQRRGLHPAQPPAQSLPRQGPQMYGHPPDVPPIRPEECFRAGLRRVLIFLVDGGPGAAHQGIHFRHVGGWGPVLPGQKNHRGG